MARTTRQKPAAIRRRQRGLLMALGLVFAVSAILRIGSLEFAFAENVVEPDLAQMPAASDLPPDTWANGNMAAPLRAALAEVEAVRARLEGREEDLIDRERAVAAAQLLVEERLAELAAAEARLEELIATSDSAAETDLDRLTRVYETMDPDRAAALFAEMEPSFAAGFLSRMNPAAGAAVMAELDPVVAYAVSVVIATRNAGAPRLPGDADSAVETEN